MRLYLRKQDAAGKVDWSSMPSIPVIIPQAWTIQMHTNIQLIDCYVHIKAIPGVACWLYNIVVFRHRMHLPIIGIMGFAIRRMYELSIYL